MSNHIAEDRRRTAGDILVEESEGVLRLNGDGQICLRSFANSAEECLPFTRNLRGFAGNSVDCTQQQIPRHLHEGTLMASMARNYLLNLRVEEAI